jgi:hypothetical protein
MSVNWSCLKKHVAKSAQSVVRGFHKISPGLRRTRMREKAVHVALVVTAMVEPGSAVAGAVTMPGRAARLPSALSRYGGV